VNPLLRLRAAGVLMLALLAVGGVAQAQGAAKPWSEVKVGQTLPDALLRGLNGPNRRLSDYRGKPLIINVWASWCGPCRAEMASLERLAWLEHAVPFAVIGISTDDYVDRAQRLLQQTNATLSHFIDKDLELETILGATHLPLTVLVNAQGQVVEKVYGAQQWDGPRALALIEQAFGRAAKARRR
jgi:thiol-disulfide isomerase/thioredoxin